jgi:hypothetical protein
MVRRRFEVIDDADTGDEIVFFYRRGRPYLFLRDRVTRRFIRRLYHIELRVIAVVDYPVERARKDNPVYIDAQIDTQIDAEEFARREEFIPDLQERLRRFLASSDEMGFGWGLIGSELEFSGEEYGSKPKYDTYFKNNEATCVVFWKHRPEEAPKRYVRRVRIYE